MSHSLLYLMTELSEAEKEFLDFEKALLSLNKGADRIDREALSYPVKHPACRNWEKDNRAAVALLLSAYESSFEKLNRLYRKTYIEECFAI